MRDTIFTLGTAKTAFWMTLCLIVSFGCDTSTNTDNQSGNGGWLPSGGNNASGAQPGMSGSGVAGLGGISNQGSGGRSSAGASGGAAGSSGLGGGNALDAGIIDDAASGVMDAGSGDGAAIAGDSATSTNDSASTVGDATSEAGAGGTGGTGSQCPEPIGFASENGGTTGGCGGYIVSVSSFDELQRAVSGSDKRIVEISGTIWGSGMMSLGSNITITGTGSGAAIDGFGFNISSQSNVIIQNLIFRNADDDSINVQSESENIWIHHCTFTAGYDGLVDIKRGSSFCTVSWNRFHDHQKTCLLGHSDDNALQDSGKLRVTYHHNYFDGSATRHPRARFGHVHVFNNYYRGCDYGVASTCEAMVLVEANYFENTNSPTLTQYGESPSGNVVEQDNIYINSGTPQTRGSAPEIPYSYAPDNAADIPSIVANGAGAENT